MEKGGERENFELLDRMENLSGTDDPRGKRHLGERKVIKTAPLTGKIGDGEGRRVPETPVMKTLSRSEHVAVYGEKKNAGRQTRRGEGTYISQRGEYIT